MKSLESIIRDVVEGKCCCEKKKKSLEHTIRDKVEEARNPAPPLNNDKFQGNQFNHINQQVGTINPPKKGHVSREGNDESTERMAQKEKVSQTRGIAFESAAEKLDPAIFLDPFGGKIPGGAAPKLPGVKVGKNATPKDAKPSNNNTKAPEAFKTAQPAVKPAPSPVVPKPDFKPNNPPTKVPAPEVPKPANDPGKSIPKIEPKPPEPVPVKPAERPKVNPMEMPKPTSKIAPIKNPLKSVANSPLTKAAAAAALLKTKLNSAGETRNSTVGQNKPSIPWVNNISVTAPTTTHFAKKHMAVEASENTPRDGDRKSIEYVGRKQKVLARQAANKVNKIDENKSPLVGVVKNAVKEKKLEIGSIGGQTKEFVTPAGSKVIVNPPEQRSTLNVDKV